MAMLVISDSTGSHEATGAALNSVSNLTFALEGAPALGGYGWRIAYLDDAPVFSGPPMTTTAFPIGVIALAEGPHVFTVKGYTYRPPQYPNPVIDSVSITFTVKNYAIPSVSLFSAKRCDAAGALKDDGTHVKYSLFGAIDPINVDGVDKNTTNIRLRYRVDGTETWSYHLLTDTLFSVADTDMVLDLGLSAASTFDFGAILEDFRSNASVETSLPRDSVIAAWNEGMFAFGKIADIDGLDCLWVSRFRGLVTLDQTPVFPSPAGLRRATDEQIGYVDFTAAASDATVVSVTFATEFLDDNVHVLHSLYTADAWGAASYFLFAHLLNITKIGFEIRIINNYASSRSGRFYWRAVAL